MGLTRLTHIKHDPVDPTQFQLLLPIKLLISPSLNKHSQRLQTYGVLVNLLYVTEYLLQKYANL